MKDLDGHTGYSEHVFNFRVPFSYIDMGGIVYNARYLDIYNHARDEYLRDIGFPYTQLYTKFNCHLSVAEVNIKYTHSIRYDEMIEVITKVKKIGTKSLVLEQSINNEQRKQLCNVGTFALVCINTSGKPQPLPEKFVNTIEQFNQVCES